MANTGIYVLSALFLIAIGSIPSLSATPPCTVDDIHACSFWNNNDCRFYRKEVRCLQQIDNTTCDASTADMLDRTLSWKTHASQECPGLPDGICIFNAIRPCDHDVPYELVIYKDLTEDQEREHCRDFKGKEDERITCFRAVRPKCTDAAVLKDLDSQISDIETMKTICARY